MNKYLTLIVLIVLVSRLSLPSSTSSGQTTTQIWVVNPEQIEITVEEGEDFAALELGDAWDMDKVTDIGYWIDIVNVSTSGGVWQGQTSGIGYFFPLFQGFSTPIGNQRSQELVWNKVGAKDPYAIQTTNYDLLSYRVFVEKPSQYFVRFTSAFPSNWPIDDPQTDIRFGGNDGCYTQTGVQLWQPGWRTYFFDLTQQNGESSVRLNSWLDFDLIRGIRIDPSASIADPQNIKIDWIRLSNSRTSPIIPIRWDFNGASQQDTVDLWIFSDKDQNLEVKPLVRGLRASDKRYDLRTSILPPGNYYIKLKLMDGNSPYNGCGKVKAESDWAGPITIIAAPTIEFVSPSVLSGEDYAEKVIGDSWDMVNSADIITPTILYPRTLSNEEFANGVFCANAVINQPMSDSQLWLNTNGAPNSYSNIRPIDANKFRYFSIRLRVDLPRDKDINWAVKYGWGSRLVWWNERIEVDGSETKYGFLLPGWNIYTIDLYNVHLPATLANPNQNYSILTPKEQNSFPSQKGWRELGNIKFLRFDPLETMLQSVGTGADRFCIDWIKLTAENKVKRGETFQVKYNAKNASKITFYYTSDPKNQPLPSSQFLEELALPNPSYPYSTFLPLVKKNFAADVYPTYLQIFNWDTTNVPSGKYYICAKVEGLASHRIYCSEVPVIVE